MICNSDWFETFHEKNNSVNIYLEDDVSHQIKGYGDGYVTFPSGHKRKI